MNTATQITTTVIYHSADFDGIFCREIAKKFLGDGPEIQFIGWDFGDAPLSIPSAGQIIIMDLPVDRVFGFNFKDGSSVMRVIEHLPGDDVAGQLKLLNERLVWIDHHASAIATHPANIPGYRIDGVSACRLAWQWFMQQWRKSTGMVWLLPDKMQFVERTVDEPLAVRLAGEYDVWDKRDPDAEVFQFGLRSRELKDTDWSMMLGSEAYEGGQKAELLDRLLADGRLLQRYQQANDAGVVNGRSFVVEFEGLKFLALNTARCNSLTFAAKDVPETGHDALMGFFFDGKAWKFSLYHAKHNTGIDLSAIAVRFGGGGHRGACGFQREHAQFQTLSNVLRLFVPEHLDLASPDKKPRLFYYEDSMNAWCPVPDLVENLLPADSVPEGETVEIEFRRKDMTDAEMAALPEI